MLTVAAAPLARPLPLPVPYFTATPLVAAAANGPYVTASPSVTPHHPPRGIQLFSSFSFPVHRPAGPNPPLPSISEERERQTPFRLVSIPPLLSPASWLLRKGRGLTQRGQGKHKLEHHHPALPSVMTMFTVLILSSLSIGGEAGPLAARPPWPDDPDLMRARSTADAAAAGVVPVELWCVAKNNAEDGALQSALDWACGSGGADCRPIQQGGACFEPNDLQFHASYAFDDYYLRNGVSQQACDFGGTAALTSLDPGNKKCHFPSSSSARNGTFTGSAGSLGLGPAAADMSGARMGTKWPCRSLAVAVVSALSAAFTWAASLHRSSPPRVLKERNVETGSSPGVEAETTKEESPVFKRRDSLDPSDQNCASTEPPAGDERS